MADTWFSLHCADIPDPVYISEVVEKTMNPNFRFFDLNVYGPAVTRCDMLTIKYWARTDNMEDYILLIELRLSLRSLQFIGKTVWDVIEAFFAASMLMIVLARGISPPFPGELYNISPF